MNTMQKNVVIAYTDVSAASSRALLGLCHPDDASVVDLSNMVDLSGQSLACVESDELTSSSANKHSFSVTHCPSQKVSCFVVNTLLPSRICHHVASKIVILCRDSGVETLVVLTSLRLECESNSSFFENCLFSAQPLTTYMPLPNKTTVSDPFLNTLMQMLIVESIPTNLLIARGYKLSEVTLRHSSDPVTVNKTVEHFQQLLQSQFGLTFDINYSQSLVYKGKNDADGDLSSTIYI